VSPAVGGFRERQLQHLAVPLHAPSFRRGLEAAQCIFLNLTPFGLLKKRARVFTRAL
jgi:hypothetical protein